MTLSVAQMRPPSPWGKTAVQGNDREGHYFLLLVVHPVCFLIGGLAGQIHAQLLHGIHIHAGQDDGGVHIAALQVGELLEGGCSSGILRGRAGQGNQDLVGVQTGVLAAQIVGLEGLDGLDGGSRNEVKLLVDAGQFFQRVEQSGGSGTQQGPVLPVTTVPSGSSMAAAGAPPVFSETAWAACSTGRLPWVSPA